jgi:hypothetical protein
VHFELTAREVLTQIALQVQLDCVMKEIASNRKAPCERSRSGSDVVLRTKLEVVEAIAVSSCFWADLTKAEAGQKCIEAPPNHAASKGLWSKRKHAPSCNEIDIIESESSVFGCRSVG